MSASTITGSSRKPRGRLPGHVTSANILDEQSARNPKIVRVINKFPNSPNKDVGEGLNTAFEAMKKLRLKDPEVNERDNSVVVNIKHSPLASLHEAVMKYLEVHAEITNAIGRDLCGIRSENSMKDVFLSLKKSGLIEQAPKEREVSGLAEDGARNPTGELLTGGRAKPHR